MALDEPPEPRLCLLSPAGREQDLGGSVCGGRVGGIQLRRLVEQSDGPVDLAAPLGHRREAELRAGETGIERQGLLERRQRRVGTVVGEQHAPVQLMERGDLRPPGERRFDACEGVGRALGSQQACRECTQRDLVGGIVEREVGGLEGGDRCLGPFACAGEGSALGCSGGGVHARALEMFDGGLRRRPVALRHGGAGPDDRRLPGVGRCAEGLRPRHVERLAGLPELHVDLREARAGVGRHLVDAKRLAELRQSALPVTELPGGLAGPVARAGVVGPQPRSLFERRECRGGIAFGEVEASLDHVSERRVRDPAAELARFVDPPRVDQQVHLEEQQLLALGGFEFDRLFERPHRVGRTLGASIEVGEQAPRCGAVDSRRRPLEAGDGRRLVAIAAQARGEPELEGEILGRFNGRSHPQRGRFFAAFQAIEQFRVEVETESVGRIALETAPEAGVRRRVVATCLGMVVGDRQASGCCLLDIPALFAEFLDPRVEGVRFFEAPEAAEGRGVHHGDRVVLRVLAVQPLRVEHRRAKGVHREICLGAQQARADVLGLGLDHAADDAHGFFERLELELRGREGEPGIDREIRGAGGLLEREDRDGRLPGLEQREPEQEAGFGIARCRLEERAQRLDRFGHLPAVLQRAPFLEEPLGIGAAAGNDHGNQAQEPQRGSDEPAGTRIPSGDHRLETSPTPVRVPVRVPFPSLQALLFAPARSLSPALSGVPRLPPEGRRSLTVPEQKLSPEPRR